MSWLSFFSFSLVSSSIVTVSAIRLLSSLQLDAFRYGGVVRTETRVCGRRGAYFIQETRDMAPGDHQDWLIVADVDYGLCEVASLKRTLAAVSDLKSSVLEDVEEFSFSLDDRMLKMRLTVARRAEDGRPYRFTSETRFFTRNN